MKNQALWHCTYWVLLLFTPLSFAGGDANWPQFHGPGGTGWIAGTIPEQWNVETGENIAWKVPIPGLGHSSPVIWGDKIFVTSAVSDQEQSLKVGLYGNIAPVEGEGEFKFKLYCLDKKTGELLWEQTAFEGEPKIKRHTKASHANSSPAVDGKHVLAFFGSEGLHCFDMKGQRLWSKDFGTLDAGFFRAPTAQWGFGSSPVIHDGKVVVQCDVQGDSFLALLDVKTGEELWRVARDEVPTWGTPTVHGATGQIIVNGWKHIGGYSLADGKERWRMTGLGDIPTPTPVVNDGLVYLTSAHGPGRPLYAVKLDASGDITPKENDQPSDGVVWWHANKGAYMPTPVVVGDYVFNANDRAILLVFHKKTGEIVHEARLGNGGAITASTIAVGDKVVATTEEGMIFVISAKGDFPILAENDMAEVCMATPAAADNHLFIRTRSHLVAIGE